MPKFYLPTNYVERIALKHEPTGKKTILLIPGAAQMDGSELREIIQWQKEKFDKEAAEAARHEQKRRYSREEVGKALKEFRDQCLRRQGSSKGRIYF